AEWRCGRECWPLVAAGVVGLARARLGCRPTQAGGFSLLGFRHCDAACACRGGGRNGADGATGVELEKLPCADAEANTVGWGRNIPPGPRGEIISRRCIGRGFRVANAGGCAALTGGTPRLGARHHCRATPNWAAKPSPDSGHHTIAFDV
ncbi:hypothetical protein TraAM80_10564, partial [Trypanosoma rangeli]